MRPVAGHRRASSSCYPITGRVRWRRAYGFGIWNRLNGAVHQFNERQLRLARRSPDPEEELSAEEKKHVSALKRGSKEASDEDAAAEKERSRLAAEARKVQDRADAANKKATDAVIEANRARSAAEVGPRKGSKR
jgi:hypothetical protein